jgi:hypothetical protein
MLQGAVSQACSTTPYEISHSADPLGKILCDLNSPTPKAYNCLTVIKAGIFTNNKHTSNVKKKKPLIGQHKNVLQKQLTFLAVTTIQPRSKTKNVSGETNALELLRHEYVS